MEFETLERGCRSFGARASEYFVPPVVLLTALGSMIVAWSLVRALAG